MANAKSALSTRHVRDGFPEKHLLDDLVQRIVRVAQPDKIVLFGSAARGEMTKNSDLDVLVVKAGEFHRGKLSEHIYQSLAGIGIAVDVVVAKPEDIAQYGDSPALVFYAALREGKVLYGS